MTWHAKAVELDLMRPVVAGRNPPHQLAQFGLDPLRRRGKVRDRVLRGGTDSTIYIRDLSSNGTENQHRTMLAKGLAVDRLLDGFM